MGNHTAARVRGRTGATARTMRDAYGQRVPFSQAQFEEALAGRTQLAKSVMGWRSAMAGILRINGHDYIAKTASRHSEREIPAAAQARYEVAVPAAMRALGYSAYVPHGTWQVQANGRTYSVATLEPGSPVRTRNQPDVVAQVPLTQIQHAYLASYLLGMRDRHGGNLLYDSQARQLRHIDFEYDGLRRSTATEKSDVTRRMWQMQVGKGAPQTIPRSLVRAALGHESAVERALAHYGVSASERAQVAARFDALRHMLADTSPLTVQRIAAEHGEAPRWVWDWANATAVGM